MSWTLTQRWKNDALYMTAAAAIRFGLALPRSWLPRAGSFLGSAAHALLGQTRRSTLANLALVHPHADAAWRRAEAREIFRSLGRDLTDTLALLDPREAPERTLHVPAASRDVLRGALSEGRGVLYVTCHLGPWERMAALLAKLDFPITTVARESYDPRFHGLIYDKLRDSRKVEVIYRGQAGAPFAVVRALRRGRVLGLLMDLPGRIATRDVDWLGLPSRVPVGPARVALRTRSPIVVGTPAPGGEALEVHIARLPTADLDADEQGEARLSQRIADALSDRIRTLPTHWPWMHPSFSVPPHAAARR